MKTLVNITIEEDLMQKVESYAAEKHVSVSDLVEEYFETVITKAKKKNFVEMINSLPKPNIDDNLDLKKAYYEERASKYGF